MHRVESMRSSGPVKIELLYFDGCPNYEALLPHLRRLLETHGVEADVELRRIASTEEAEAAKFLGSPTVRINGSDVEPGAEDRDGFGMQCRLFRTQDGYSPVPPDEWVLAALDRRT
jgi:hypothetical protein